MKDAKVGVGGSPVCRVLCSWWCVVVLVQARKVQFKDAMEEEWEKFQKSIQQEEKVGF